MDHAHSRIRRQHRPWTGSLGPDPFRHLERNSRDRRRSHHSRSGRTAGLSLGSVRPGPDFLRLAMTSLPCRLASPPTFPAAIARAIKLAQDRRRRGAARRQSPLVFVQETSGTQSADASTAPAASPRPLLVYDGDCGFCAYWARYWQKLTGDRVEYRPYQEVAPQYPAISQAEFQRAVQFIAPDGHRAAAAEASFLTLSHARGKGFWLALYRRLPGFAPISELVYAFIAARRPAFFRMSLMLWGRNHEPPRYDLVSFLFLRLFGLITLVGLRLLRRAGARAHRQPRHPAAGRNDRRPRRPSRAAALLPHANGLLDQRQRRRHSGRMLGGGRAFAHARLQPVPARDPVSHLRPLPLAVLRRANLHELPVGHVPPGNRVCRASDEPRHDAGDLARALALVPLHVHVGRRQAFERRSQLVEFVGAELSLFDPTAADAAGVVRGAAAARPLESRNRRPCFSSSSFCRS